MGQFIEKCQINWKKQTKFQENKSQCKDCSVPNIWHEFLNEWECEESYLDEKTLKSQTKFKWTKRKF
jgi:hypothetical protein